MLAAPDLLEAGDVMNGPQHYREAERLIAAGEAVAAEIRATKHDEARRDALGKQAMGIWAQAQVHATLAQVAATAYPIVRDHVRGDAIRPDGKAWAEVTAP